MTATIPHNGTDTSRAAAEFIRPHAPSLREQVFQYVASQGFNGATIEEIADALGIKQATVCGRVNELHTARAETPPRICNSGRKRKTSSGVLATVWWHCAEPIQLTLAEIL